MRRKSKLARDSATILTAADCPICCDELGRRLEAAGLHKSTGKHSTGVCARAAINRENRMYGSRSRFVAEHGLYWMRDLWVAHVKRLAAPAKAELVAAGAAGHAVGTALKDQLAADDAVGPVMPKQQRFPMDVLDPTPNGKHRKPSRSVCVRQEGPGEPYVYVVERTANTLRPGTGERLMPKAIQALIDDGVRVEIS